MSLIKSQEPFILSEGDLEKLELFGKVTINALLYHLGMDVAKGYEKQQCTHRSEATGEIYKDGIRYFGRERTDIKWLREKGVNI